MYRSQSNFAKFCATNAFVISRQNLIYPNMLACSAYGFLVRFDLWIILHHLTIILLHEVGFVKVQNILH